MCKLVLTLLTSAVLLVSATLAHAQNNAAQVTGTVAYHERIALPSDAVIDLQLIDTSVADIAAQTVAEALINVEGRQVPVPFALAYDPSQIVPEHRYSVRATIRSGDGMLMFSSTQAYPVLTHGAPSKANLILHTVGHGARPGATAKKQATPAVSEGTASASAQQAAPPSAAESTSPVSTTAPSSNEPTPTGVTSNAPQPEKAGEQTAQRETVASGSGAESESKTAPETKPTIAGSMPPKEPVPSEPARPEAESNSQSPAAQSAPAPQESAPLPIAPITDQQSSPAETPTATATATSEPPTAPPEASPVISEPSAPSESKAEPVSPAAEAKAAEPETTLPEAPSASKRAELEAAAPEAPEGESTSRPDRLVPNKSLTPLADTQWKLVQLDGRDVVITPPQKPVTLAFSPEGRRIAGSAGCNSYLGIFTDDHGRLHLNPGNMTLMTCADPAGIREKKFVNMLRSADGYQIDGDSLTLTSGGKTVAKFKINPPL